MKLKTNVLLAALALLLPITSHAATCTRADLTGTWRLFSVFDSVGRCTLSMPGSGTAVSTTSTCWLPGVATVSLRGNLNIASDCRVYGNITVGADGRQVEAYISKGKDSISGIAWLSSNPYVGDQFSGVKQ